MPGDNRLAVISISGSSCPIGLRLKGAVAPPDAAGEDAVVLKVKGPAAPLDADGARATALKLR